MNPEKLFSWERASAKEQKVSGFVSEVGLMFYLGVTHQNPVAKLFDSYSL